MLSTAHPSSRVADIGFVIAGFRAANLIISIQNIRHKQISFEATIERYDVVFCFVLPFDLLLNC